MLENFLMKIFQTNRNFVNVIEFYYVGGVFNSKFQLFFGLFLGFNMEFRLN